MRQEIGDRWHLGSITKSITTTMIGRLVESGQIEWSDTIGECFPDASIHDDWMPVILKQLLTYTAGAPPNFSLQVRMKQPELGPQCMLARREAVLNVLAEIPAHPPGEKFTYSNVGYAIAGAMADKMTGATWKRFPAGMGSPWFMPSLGTARARQCFWTDRSTVSVLPASVGTSSHQLGIQAIGWLWTISPVTSHPRRSKPSRRWGPRSFTCRLIRLT